MVAAITRCYGRGMNATDPSPRPTAADAAGFGALGTLTDADRILARGRLDLDALGDALAADDALGVFAAAGRMAATAAEAEALAVRMRA